MRNILALCCLVLVASCARTAAPVVQWQSPTGVTQMESTVTSAPEPQVAREVRYYRVESGAYWDDRGRKLAPGEKPVTSTVP